MMVVRYSLLSAAWLVLAGLPAVAEEPARGDAPSAVPSSRDPASERAERRQAAAALVAQLANPRYDAREEATKKLEKLGTDAIESLVAAAVTLHGPNLVILYFSAAQ